MSDYLPEPIIEKILLNMPTKCLMKCTAVCKSWMSLIKSSTFIHTYLNRNNNTTRLFLLNAFSQIQHRSKSYSLLWDDPVFGDCKLIDPITYTVVYERGNVPAQSLLVVGTCNGLVCLAPRPQYAVDSPVLVWNPSIRKIVVLPSTPPLPRDNLGSSLRRYAFGYDSSTDDYKVLVVMTSMESMMGSQGDIYSLASGTWKSLSAAAGNSANIRPPQFFDAPSFVNVIGYPHWYGDDLYYGGYRGDYIMSFDMVSEVFCKIKVPEALREQISWCTKYGDCLALAAEKWSFEFDIWVMKEYGVAESWTKLTLRHWGDLNMEELIYCRSEELVFQSDSGILRIVDCGTGQVKEFAIRAERCFMDSFVESSLLLGHADAISY